MATKRARKSILGYYFDQRSAAAALLAWKKTHPRATMRTGRKGEKHPKTGYRIDDAYVIEA